MLIPGNFPIPIIPAEIRPFLAGLPFFLQMIAMWTFLLIYIGLIAFGMLWGSWTIFERLMERHDPYFAYMRSKK